MEKLVYVVWKKPELEAADFRSAVLGPIAGRLAASGASKISANFADEDVEAVQTARLTHLDPPIDAVVSFWMDDSDLRGPQEQALADVCNRLAGYLVAESVPLANTTHTAPLGERVPGVNMVSLIEKPEEMDYLEWIGHWRGHHRKVALETQATYLYVRNVVVHPLTDDAPPWRGIVEEGFPTEAVTDPMIWYRAGGDQNKMQENLARMIESVQAFLDINRVESHPMSQYVLSQ